LALAGLACGLLIGAADMVCGQSDTRTRPGSSPAPIEPRAGVPRIRKASAILGAYVRLEEGGTVGKVQDFILSGAGAIDFLVVSNQGTYFLVPWAAATVDFDQQGVFLDISREKFRDVPTFTADTWPDLTDGRYTDKVRSIFVNAASARKERGTGLDPGVSGFDRRFTRTGPQGNVSPNRPAERERSVRPEQPVIPMTSPATERPPVTSPQGPAEPPVRPSRTDQAPRPGDIGNRPSAPPGRP